MSFFVYPDVLKYDIINTSKYRKGEAMKKLLSTITAAVIMLTAFSIVPSAGAASTNAADYTYTITPILSPFNEYFFVKTDNPDPFSFRFADKSTIYADSDYIAMPGSSGSITLYADVNYEDTSTGRVNGGYIFRSNSYNTDGGKIVLQTKSGSTWTDTSVKYDLPKSRTTGTSRTRATSTRATTSSALTAEAVPNRFLQRQSIPTATTRSASRQ